jgi:hypothetical protein
MNDKVKTDEFALRVFACLLIFTGVDSVVGMVYDLFHDSLNVDFGFLGIFIGKGLLERKDIWRKWAVFLAWAGIVCSPVAGAVFAYCGSHQPVELYGVKTDILLPSYLVFILLAAWFIFSLWQRKVLAKQQVRNQFTATGNGCNSWWSAIAAIAILFSCVHCSTGHLLHRLLESIGHHEATIHLLDADTGEALNPTIGGPNRASGQIIPKVSFGFRTSKDDTTVATVSWLACNPITINVSSKGYSKQDVVLKPEDDGKELRITLEKVTPSNQAIDSDKK